MNPPRLNSLILIFALLYPACAQEELELEEVVLILYSETNQQGQGALFNRTQDNFWEWVCHIELGTPFPIKSLSLSGSEKCILLYRDEGCAGHIFRIFPGIAINNDLTSTSFSSFPSLAPCFFPNNSGLLFYKQSDSPAFYNTSAIETYTGCQNLPDIVKNEDIEGVQLIGACANLFSNENCTGEVFYLRPINAGRSPPAIAQGRWYDYFPLQTRVASFSPCGANWTTNETGTAVTGSTDGPTTETEEPISLQPSLHSCTPNIFAPICILIYLLTM